jgi:hypothetical protein
MRVSGSPRVHLAVLAQTNVHTQNFTCILSPGQMGTTLTPNSGMSSGGEITTFHQVVPSAVFATKYSFQRDRLPLFSHQTHTPKEHLC